MKLPHLEPLIFAKEVLEQTSNHAKILCEFESVPKMTTFIEAAAQSSSSFVEPTKPMRGFLATAKNITQHYPMESLSYVVILELEAQIGEYRQFTFEGFEKANLEKAVISGSFTVVIQEV